MKTTVNLTIHAPSRKAAKFCLESLLIAWYTMQEAGDTPANAFLEYGKPKGIRHGKKKK